MRKKGRKPRKRRTSSLSEHKQTGKRLDPPFIAQFGENLRPMRWDQELLPEYLWIASLFIEHPFEEAMQLFGATLDLLDPYNPETNTPLLGTISSFSLIPEADRGQALEALSPVYDRSIARTIGHCLALHPDCPAGWLVNQNVYPSPPPDEEGSIAYLTGLVRFLLPGDEHEVIKFRGIPLNRLFKHNKLLLSAGLSQDLLDGIRDYPNTPHRDRVDQWTKLTTMMVLSKRTEAGPWARYFWRRNYALSPCEREEPGPLEAETGNQRIQALLTEGEICYQTLKAELLTLTSQAGVDLFDPVKDEVLLGLLARQLRMVGHFLTKESCWTDDLAGILLRCVADTLITFAWLCEKGTEDDFRRFREYGLGKQKLYKLHLENKIDSEDETPTHLEREQQAAEAKIASEINEELLSIELASWHKSDARKMALEVGLQDEHRLTYAPASSVLHAEWVPLKEHYLSRCVNPLHRGHLLLGVADPQIRTGYALRALLMFEKTVRKWAEVYGLQVDLKSTARYRAIHKGD